MVSKLQAPLQWSKFRVSLRSLEYPEEAGYSCHLVVLSATTSRIQSSSGEMPVRPYLQFSHRQLEYHLSLPHLHSRRRQLKHKLSGSHNSSSPRWWLNNSFHLLVAPLLVHSKNNSCNHNKASTIKLNSRLVILSRITNNKLAAILSWIANPPTQQEVLVDSRSEAIEIPQILKTKVMYKCQVEMDFLQLQELSLRPSVASEFYLLLANTLTLLQYFFLTYIILSIN